MRIPRWLAAVALSVALVSCCALPLSKTAWLTVRDDVPTGPLVAGDYPIPDHVDFKAEPVLWMDGPMTPEMAREMIMIMETEAIKGARQINIVIDSNGGSVESGLEIAERIDDFHRSGIQINCIVKGQALSMAWYTLQACSVRAATSTSMLHVHEPFAINVTEGDRHALRERANKLDVIVDRLAAIGSLRLNISKDAFKARIDGNDWFMTPSEALSIGAIDMVVLPTDAPSEKVVRTAEEAAKELEDYLRRLGYDLPKILKQIQEGP